MDEMEKCRAEFGAKLLCLLQGARAGSREDLGKLLECFRTVLTSYARSRIPWDLEPRLSPSDLVQETFIEADRDLHEFSGKTVAKTYAWLTSILRNNLRNHVRKQHAQRRDVTHEVRLADHQDSLLDAGAAPLQVLEQREEDALLHEALGQMAPEDVEILKLHFYEELSFEEIGARLGCSEATARRHCDHAVGRLGRRLRRGL